MSDLLAGPRGPCTGLEGFGVINRAEARSPVAAFSRSLMSSAGTATGLALVAVAAASAFDFHGLQWPNKVDSPVESLDTFAFHAAITVGLAVGAAIGAAGSSRRKVSSLLGSSVASAAVIGVVLVAARALVIAVPRSCANPVAIPYPGLQDFGAGVPVLIAIVLGNMSRWSSDAAIRRWLVAAAVCFGLLAALALWVRVDNRFVEPHFWQC